MHALSIPTWLVHIGSVTEWTIAIVLAWIYADVSQNKAWRGLSLAMLPALASAITVCTWHWFDNTPALQWLSLVQAAITFIGNCTLLLAGWWLWKQPFRPQ